MSNQHHTEQQAKIILSKKILKALKQKAECEASLRYDAECTNRSRTISASMRDTYGIRGKKAEMAYANATMVKKLEAWR